MITKKTAISTENPLVIKSEQNENFSYFQMQGFHCDNLDGVDNILIFIPNVSSKTLLGHSDEEGFKILNQSIYSTVNKIRMRNIDYGYFSKKHFPVISLKGNLDVENSEVLIEFLNGSDFERINFDKNYTLTFNCM